MHIRIARRSVMPVLLTAITTILGLIPMVTGISINFRKFSISLVSETSQYWKSMSIVVIFGLLVATFLTLLVVPTLYSLFATFWTDLRAGYANAKRLYWKPFDYVTRKWFPSDAK